MALTWTNSAGVSIGESTGVSPNVGDEVTANIVLNDDDVSWVYIDWDDGVDNSSVPVTVVVPCIWHMASIVMPLIKPLVLFLLAP